MYYVGPGDNDAARRRWRIYCLMMGSVTSYARARAESLGMQAKVGIAERVRPAGLDPRDDRARGPASTCSASVTAPLWAIPVTLGVLAVASTITVVQRILVGPEPGARPRAAGEPRPRAGCA